MLNNYEFFKLALRKYNDLVAHHVVKSNYFTMSQHSYPENIPKTTVVNRKIICAWGFNI